MSDAIPTYPKPNAGNRASIIGFIAVCYGIIGLVGIFASYAVSIPLDRALAREAVLDEAQVALHSADPKAALEALKLKLDDSYDALSKLPADPDRAVAAERVAMRARLVADSVAIGERMRWMIVVITLMAGGFGIALSGGMRRG